MTGKPKTYTALMGGIVRAAHQLFDPDPKIFSDPLAVKILGPGMDSYILKSREQMSGPVDLLGRSHFNFRSRFAEDRLQQAIKRGVSQYVILGAGLDTFAYRQPQWACRLSIFELDLPETRSMKLNQLRQADLPIPDNTRHITFDHSATSLAACLRENGIAPSEPTFFSWLGVTIYLKKTEIVEALNTMASYPAGSEVALTYLHPVDLEYIKATRLSKDWDEQEPIVSSFTPEALEQMLTGCGFRTLHFPTIQEAKERYYQNGAYPLPLPTGFTLDHLSIAAAMV